MTKGAKKVCILTGGGDAPGLNAVIRGFVKRASLSGIEAYGSEDGFEGLLGVEGACVRRLRVEDVRGILPRGGSILGCSNKSNPFKLAVAKGSKETRDASGEILQRVRAEGFDTLVMVGGDGTMHYARKFIALGIPCIGVPKTIDNDLGGTDQTFGFETAVNTATWAIDALHSTAEAHDRVMILEVMGRYTGWIALYAGMAGGADVILIPEIPYDLGRVIAKIRAREASGARFTIIVVAEGARPMGGEMSTIEAEARPGQLQRVGGAGERLAKDLQGKVEHEVRTTVLGHLQRGGSPSAFDRLLGTRMGVHAADLCARGASGRLVVLEGTSIKSIALEEVPDRPRFVDADGQLCASARSVGVELGAAGSDRVSLSLPPPAPPAGG
jgi:ATP-dependent phosphofructokinase / diphosphate-dependent phosphofructokinase